MKNTDSGPIIMTCVYCGHRKKWPYEFPERSVAKCMECETKDREEIANTKRFIKAVIIYPLAIMTVLLLILNSMFQIF